MRNRLPLASLPSTSAFIRAYISDFERVAAWYDYDPHAADWAEKRLADLRVPPMPERAGTAALLAQQQLRWGADEQAIEGAEALAHDNTYMVVTGQQPGLFGGPLYTQLKALTAIILARHLQHQFPTSRFVPVFWIASADSDFDEVRRTALIDRRGNLRRLELPSQGPDGTLLARRMVAAKQWERLIGQVADSLPGGPHRDEVEAELRRAYTGAELATPGSLVHGFAHWMARLFRGTGLVLAEPQGLLNRPDVGGLYVRQLGAAAEAEAAVAKRNAELLNAGFPLQVPFQPSDSQLFYVDDAGSRDKLLYRPDGSFSGKRSAKTWSRAELQDLARREPLRLAPTALFRPLVESMLFPCAAWVGGQAELLYRAQSTALFAFHGLRHPPAFLRHHATLLPDRGAQLLDEHGWEFPDLPPSPRDWARLCAEQTLPQPVHAALRSYHLAATHADDKLQQAVETNLPELQRSMRTMRGKLEWHLARVERKVLAAALRREAGPTAQLLALHAELYPEGKPQERSLNLLTFLPQAGFELIPRSTHELEVPCWDHCLIIVD